MLLKTDTTKKERKKRRKNKKGGGEVGSLSYNCAERLVSSLSCVVTSPFGTPSNCDKGSVLALLCSHILTFQCEAHFTPEPGSMHGSNKPTQTLDD